MISPDSPAGLLDPAAMPALDVGGPSIRHLVRDGDGPHLLRGVVGCGMFIPLHSHRDPETFTLLTGTLEGLLVRQAEEPTWSSFSAGDVFHVPGDVRHAWRNTSTEAAVAVIATTPRLSAFFAEIGEPVDDEGDTQWPPGPETLSRLLKVSERYGYWNATPAENAAVGIPVPS